MQKEIQEPPQQSSGDNIANLIPVSFEMSYINDIPEEDSIKFPLKKCDTLRERQEKRKLLKQNQEEQEKNYSLTSAIQIEDLIMKDNSLKFYRQKIKKQVWMFSAFIVLLIIERILYSILLGYEQLLLEQIQASIGLSFKQADNHFSEFRNNALFEITSFAVNFNNQFLILTHFFMTIFVSFSDFIGIKLVFSVLLGEYLILMLQLIYNGPMPFWTKEEISTPICVNTCAHPSMIVFVTLFCSFYFLFCIHKHFSSKNKASPDIIKNHLKKIRTAQGTLLLLLLAYFFIIYLSGLLFIINFCLALIFFICYYIVITKLNGSFSRIIADVTIYPDKSKRYIFYWIFFLISLGFFAFLLLLSSDIFVDINWIGNYLNCTNLQNTYLFDQQPVGPYKSFSTISVLSAIAGALFGLSYTYGNINQDCVKTWYKGSLKLRILRGLCVNLFIIPSWLLIINQPYILQKDYLINAGFSELLIDCLHFFFLYLLLFGVIPVHLFSPLKLVYIKLKEIEINVRMSATIENIK